MNSFVTRSTFLVCLLVLSSGAIRAQDRTPGAPVVPDLPANPAMWVNSSPISKEMLAGKAAVFYFFEEQCPSCEGAWPKVLETPVDFEGQPVMFIAVNSGTPRQQVEGYLRRNKVAWPTICDPDRTFEKQFEFEISLQNISQVQLLMPDGSFQNGNFRDLKASSESAAKDAKWKVDPKGIPVALQTAWMAIEFGKYPEAARPVTRALTQKGATGEVAQQLNQIVTSDMTAQLDVAKKSLDDGNKWDAFKRYTVISAKFKGFPIPADATASLKELTTDPAIKAEQAAQKTLDRAKLSASKSPAARKGAIKQLQALVKDHADTEAGKEAQTLLDQVAME